MTICEIIISDNFGNIARGEPTRIYFIPDGVVQVIQSHAYSRAYLELCYKEIGDKKTYNIDWIKGK